MTEARLIKKYPNRSLYDTGRSKYISVVDLRQYVNDEVAFIVQEAKSGKDITGQVLLQIILEQESNGPPVFTTEVLRRIIKICDLNGFNASQRIDRFSGLLDFHTREFMDTLQDSRNVYNGQPGAEDIPEDS